jgi:hypothetical protein
MVGGGLAVSPEARHGGWWAGGLPRGQTWWVVGWRSLAALVPRGKSASFCVFSLEHTCPNCYIATVGHGEPCEGPHPAGRFRWPGLFSQQSWPLHLCLHRGRQARKTPCKISKISGPPVFLSLFHWRLFVATLHYSVSRTWRALSRAAHLAGGSMVGTVVIP